MTRAFPRKFRVIPASLNHSRGSSPALGVFLILGACTLSFATKLFARWGLTPAELTAPTRLYLQIEWSSLLTVGVLATTLYVDRRPLTSIGLRRPGGWDVSWAIAFFIVGGATQLLLKPVVSLSGLNVIPIRTLELRPILDWGSIVAAAVGEELVFRGYLLERLEELSGSAVAAVVLSSALFGLWHLPIWGGGEIILAGSWGILVALLYVWRRNLPACMLAHLLEDAVGARDLGFRFGPSRRGYWFLSVFVRVARR